jgi:hypothetical protein
MGILGLMKVLSSLVTTLIGCALVALATYVAVDMAMGGLSDPAQAQFFGNPRTAVIMALRLIPIMLLVGVTFVLGGSRSRSRKGRKTKPNDG